MTHDPKVRRMVREQLTGLHAEGIEAFIAQLREEREYYEAKGYTEFTVGAVAYDEYSASIKLFGKRLENDTEYAKRMEELEKSAKWEKETYDRLKKKFDPE